MRETLRFAAQLRLEEHMTDHARNRRADDVMHMLGLAPAADVLVGNAEIKVRANRQVAVDAQCPSWWAADSRLLLACLPRPCLLLHIQGISGGQARRLTIGVEIMHMSEVGTRQQQRPSQPAVPLSYGHLNKNSWRSCMSPACLLPSLFR